MCAIRVSVALNTGGGAIDPSLVPKDTQGRNQWSTGDDGNKYVFRVEALIGYLENAYGAPDEVLTGDNRKLSNIDGKGILIFDMRGGNSGNDYTGHATIFDGSRPLDREDYSDRSSRILFWRLPEE